MLVNPYSLKKRMQVISKCIIMETPRKFIVHVNLLFISDNRFTWCFDNIIIWYIVIITMHTYKEPITYLYFKILLNYTTLLSEKCPERAQLQIYSDIWTAACYLYIRNRFGTETDVCQNTIKNLQYSDQLHFNTCTFFINWTYP